MVVVLRTAAIAFSFHPIDWSRLSSLGIEWRRRITGPLPRTFAPAECLVYEATACYAWMVRFRRSKAVAAAPSAGGAESAAFRVPILDRT